MSKNKISSKEPISLGSMPHEYTGWLNDLKHRIHTAQQRAILQVNKELVLLYWQIGQDILNRQNEQGWGSKVIDRLAHDLSIAFPNVKGFSPRNLKYMRAFAQAWQDKAIVQEVLAQLPWYHHIALLDKLNSAETRYWYVLKTIENNWSRNVLVMQVESLKDPYLFDFLALTDKAQEREIEGVLVKHVTETHSITEGLPREIELRKQQYEYYHDLLLSFPKPEVVV